MIEWENAKYNFKTYLYKITYKIFKLFSNISKILIKKFS